jgi:hypothetical protein
MVYKKTSTRREQNTHRKSYIKKQAKWYILIPPNKSAFYNSKKWYAEIEPPKTQKKIPLNA